MATKEHVVQLRKGVIELAVLKIIEEKSRYGYEIITQLDKVGFEIVQGTLYPLLTRLRKEGLVSYEWQESQQGPPRKYYELTPEGQDHLTAMSEEWLRISTAMNRLLRKKSN